MPVLMQNNVFLKSKLLDFFHPPCEMLQIQGQGQPWNIYLRDFRSHQLLHVPRLKMQMILKVIYHKYYKRGVPRSVGGERWTCNPKVSGSIPCSG